MEEPKNPYTKRNNEYLERAAKRNYHNAEVFFADASYCSGQRKGWDEGFILGEESWFNLDSQNDCADRLFVFLSRLADRVETEFGEFSQMKYLLQDIHWTLAAANLPVNPPETEENYINGVWVQPFEYADELD